MKIENKLSVIISINSKFGMSQQPRKSCAQPIFNPTTGKEVCAGPLGFPSPPNGGVEGVIVSNFVESQHTIKCCSRKGSYVDSRTGETKPCQVVDGQGNCKHYAAKIAAKITAKKSAEEAAAAPAAAAAKPQQQPQPKPVQQPQPKPAAAVAEPVAEQVVDFVGGPENHQKGCKGVMTNRFGKTITCNGCKKTIMKFGSGAGQVNGFQVLGTVMTGVAAVVGGLGDVARNLEANTAAVASLEAVNTGLLSVQERQLHLNTLTSKILSLQALIKSEKVESQRVKMEEELMELHMQIRQFGSPAQ
jgi:hypothetical protein